jgi:hypothetical protein
MKKIFKTISLLTLTLSLTAAATEIRPMTFDSILLTKNSKSTYGLVYIPNRLIEAWCAGFGNPMSVMSYEVAETMEKLADGLYRCSGKFLQVPSDRTYPVQIFQLDSCIEKNPVDLRASSCPIPTK